MQDESEVATERSDFRVCVAVIRGLLQEDEVVGRRDILRVLLDLQAAALRGLHERGAVVATLKMVAWKMEERKVEQL